MRAVFFKEYQGREIMDNKKQQMSESFFIGAVLAVVGGYLDVYTYISRGQVFANAQTGNIVLFGIWLAKGDISKAVMYLPPIIAFIAGIMICEMIRRNLDGRLLHWRQYVILLEVVIITLVGIFPMGKAGGINFDTISNVLISFVCSLQVQSFREIRGIVCATTMCTGNLRSASECLEKYRVEKDKKYLHNAGKYFGIDLFFIVGAVISTFVTDVLMERSVIVCSVVLLIVFMLLFVPPDRKPKANN